MSRDTLDQYGELTLAMAQSLIASSLSRVKKRDVAKRLGTSPSYLSNLQKGETDLTMRQLGRVLAAAGFEVRFWLVPVAKLARKRRSPDAK